MELPLGLLPAKAEQEEARRLGSPFYPDGLGLPSVAAYGYGQQSTAGTRDPDAYRLGLGLGLGLGAGRELEVRVS